MPKKKDRSKEKKKAIPDHEIRNIPDHEDTEEVQEAENRVSIDELELRSEEVQEILTRVPHWMIRQGNTLFFILILLVLAISWFVKYPDIIPSKTYITTQIQPQKEYARTMAKISKLFVEDKQKVSKNTALAILENTANYKDVFQLKSIIDTITLNNRSFSFPVNLDSLPILYLGDIDDYFGNFEDSYIDYMLNRELKPFDHENQANRRSLAETRNRLANSIAERKLAESELNLKKTDLDRHKELLGKGVISQQQYDSKELESLQAKRNLSRLNLSISQLREGISGATMTSKGTEISKKREEKSLLKAVNQSFILLQRAIKNWELNYVLQSDIDGKVFFMDTWAVNQTVNNNELVFTVIPSENSSYIAILRAPARNSGKIKTGQTVNIKLENYPDEEYGVLKGHVENINPIPDKDDLYQIKVALPEKLITTYDKEIPFKPEMPGTAEIITEDLRLIERFFYQLKDVFSR